MPKIKERVLLIVPPTGLYIREERNQVPVRGLIVPSIRPPIDLCYMAAVLEKLGIKCKIMDMPVQGLAWKDLEKTILDFYPDALIISNTIFTLSSDMQSCYVAKKINPDILTITKGAYVAEEDVRIMEKFPLLDVIIRGEYEVTLAELAKNGVLESLSGVTYRKGGSVIRNDDRPFIEDLDSLPFPSRGLINNQLYIRADTSEPMTTVQAARGCPHSCIFCLSSQVYGRKVRQRSIRNIVSEIKECTEIFKISNFFLRADTFTFDREWVIGLCKEIVKERMAIHWVCNARVDSIDEEMLKRMKEAGCWGIALGIESGSQKTLDKIKKRVTFEQARRAVNLCRESGIQSLLYFIIGLPWEDKEDIVSSIRFAKELKGDYVEFNIGVPFPGTEFYRLAKELNLMVSDDFESFGYCKPIARTISLSINDVLKLRRKALRDIYFDPLYVTRTLYRAGSLKKMLRLLNFAFYKMVNIRLWQK